MIALYLLLRNWNSTFRNIVISRTTEGASEDFNYTFTNVISSTEYLVSLHTLSDSVISSSGISISLKTYNLQGRKVFIDKTNAKAYNLGILNNIYLCNFSFIYYITDWDYISPT